MLFNSELALVNRELNKKWPYLEPYVAQFSGQARWVRILRRRIDRVMNVSLASPQTRSREAVEVGGCAPCWPGTRPGSFPRASPRWEVGVGRGTGRCGARTGRGRSLGFTATAGVMGGT